MRLLMIGDVVGKAGRELLISQLPTLRTKHSVDFIIVNGENVAGGVGITPSLAEEILEEGADVITLGNHAWSKRDIYSYLDREHRLLRPANYPEGAPGRGWGVFACPAGEIAVAVLQGRVFMEPLENPFRVADALITEMRKHTLITLIEIHAEATSEKQAFAWHLDGKLSAVVGTHTHVQTADERILPGGTAYITDVGMTGPTHSVIGMECTTVINRFLNQLPARFEAAEGDAQLCGVLIDVDSVNGKATRISRLQSPAHITRTQ